MVYTNQGPIEDSSIYIKASMQLKAYINKIKTFHTIPKGLLNNHVQSISTLFTPNIELLQGSTKVHEDVLLSIEDCNYLHDYLNEENKKNGKKIWLHELLEGSEIILPKNKEVARDKELEKRCNSLRQQQANAAYFRMTKNFDMKKYSPDDTIGYQLKQINKDLLAVFQFIISVIVGFIFGFFGIQLLTGYIDHGTKIVLGIVCAIIVAVAELYFLIKQLNI